MKALFVIFSIVAVLACSEKKEQPALAMRTAEQVAHAIKQAPALVQRWRSEQSEEAGRTLQEYLTFWRIPAAKLGITPKEVAQLRQAFPNLEAD